MIHHHLTAFQQKKQISFQIDQKKLVKTYIYQNQQEWIQYFTGFLFMEPNQQGKVDLKVYKLWLTIQIRFSRHPHMAQIQAGIRFPLQLFTDEQGLYTLIHQQLIKTVQKPEQKLLYLKIGHEGRILAISFHNKTYCRALLQHLTLILQNNQSTEMTWTQQNLWFLSSSMKQNLMYVDSVFILQERILQFCNFFNKVDKRLYQQQKKDLECPDQKYMQQFFQIVKNMFLRANHKIIHMFITHKYEFETVLKCLSYNPFGVYYFDYLEQYKKMTIINNQFKQIQNKQFLSKYELIAKVKFLRDVAICTFIEIPTQAVFNEVLNGAYMKILSTLSDPETHLIQKLNQLNREDQYKFLCVFTQIWGVFKAVLEDLDTLTIKQMFYLEWIQSGMFSQTLSALGRLLKQKQVSDVHPRFWQKLMESINPMLSYEWNQSQKIILHHRDSINREETMDFMSSLIMILANCDSNTKSLVLEYVRVQIQISQNRKHISAKYLSYVYNNFVRQSFQYCNNEQNIEIYIDFIQKIYMAEPIRTRHFLVENNIILGVKPYFQNKFIFIMLLKLLKTFIEVGDSDTFKYLSTSDFYDCLRQKYAVNQNLQNVTNSVFMSIFKLIETMSNKQGKKYLNGIFFGLESKPVDYKKQNISSGEKQVPKSFKRTVPAAGLQKQTNIKN